MQRNVCIVALTADRFKLLKIGLYLNIETVKWTIHTIYDISLWICKYSSSAQQLFMYIHTRNYENKEHFMLGDKTSDRTFNMTFVNTVKSRLRQSAIRNHAKPRL